MRNLVILILSLAIVAAACGSNSSASVDATEASEVDQQDGDTASSSTADDVATCGFEDDLTPDRIEVAQIPGDGRDESAPSALSDSFDPSFGEPLIDVSRIRSGGPPPDGILRSIRRSSRPRQRSTGSGAMNRSYLSRSTAKLGPIRSKF